MDRAEISAIAIIDVNRLKRQTSLILIILYTTDGFTGGLSAGAGVGVNLAPITPAHAVGGSVLSGTQEVGFSAYIMVVVIFVVASREGGKTVGICSVRPPLRVTFSLHGVWIATRRLIEGGPFS